MAITYGGKLWTRPTGYVPSGSPGLPLILRNPQNDSTKYDKEKCGPSVVLKFGVNDYRMYYEGLNTTQFGGNTNFILYATSPDNINWTKAGNTPAISPTYSWHNGEVCPSEWFWNPYTNSFFMYYHGGNNVGPRQVGLLTSPTGLPGSWSFYNNGTPVLTVGAAASFDELGVADARVICLGATDYRMLYSGKRADGKLQTGYATSTDGKTWTKSGSNPVMPLGSGNDVAGVLGTFVDIDTLGRIHAWYPGVSVDGITQKILYAFSDNWTLWTRDQATVILAGSATASDPDPNVGDVIRGMADDGLLFFTTLNFNQSSYTGDAVGRLEGRGLYWLPKFAATQPTRPGRTYTKISGTREYSVLAAAAALLNSSAFTIWADFRIPPGNTFREIYTEYNAFNKQIFLRLKDTGVIDLGYRTATNSVFLTGTTRLDDNKWHRVMFVRRGVADFELFVDGVSIATSAVDCSVDASAMTIAWGNWQTSTGLPDEPTMGIMRQGVTIQGRALTAAEELNLWNNGNDGGTLPGGVTATSWVKHGSGGQAGPDTAQNSAANGTTIVGTNLVETTPAAYAPIISNNKGPVYRFFFRGFKRKRFNHLDIY